MGVPLFRETTLFAYEPSLLGLNAIVAIVVSIQDAQEDVCQFPLFSFYLLQDSM